MPDRRLHLIGSYPAATTAEEAMREAMAIAGPHLTELPDGETGERHMWIGPIVEALREHPDLEVRHEGDWSDYDHLLSLRVRRGHRLRGDTLRFGYPAEHAASRPVLDALRREQHRPDLAFQIGMPSGLGMAMFTMGPTGPFRHRRPSPRRSPGRSPRSGPPATPTAGSPAGTSSSCSSCLRSSSSRR